VHVTSYRKKLTVFFSDIQGFTELTDSMEAEPLSQLLNEYLGAMATIASTYGGTIDKFIGDGIMIFFGDPESRGEREDAIACVEMAVAMRQRVRDFQQQWLDRGVSRPLHVRMGINSGYVTVGNFGSEDRLDYTIVGGQVNAASRLEAAAEPDEILISHETWALVNDHVQCEPVGEIRVKGLAYPIRTYRVIGSCTSMPAACETIDERRDGFRLRVDPAAIAPGEAGAVREALERALRALDLRTPPETGAS
jgi:adenylate cyclase